MLVIVNKMDLADFSEARFREIEKEYRQFLTGLGLEPHAFIPASAKQGENVARGSEKMKWHRGPSVLEALDLFKSSEADVDLPRHVLLGR